MSLDLPNFNELFKQKDVRMTAIAATDTTPITPIGSIIAWAKNLTGVPTLSSNFVECNGQVLSDAGSLLNGTTIPNLNGTQTFLRGKATSGGTGGATTATATLAATGGNQSTNNSQPVGYNTSTEVMFATDSGGSGISTLYRYSSAFSILPTNYEVVWIIRVK